MDFPKKYNPKETEPKWQQYWEKNKIYKFNPNSKKKIYSIDTPPPYVSAEHLHVGHAMSYSQAEFIARYKRMQGFEVFYPMGFDDNGLPTERYVEKKYKINKSKISRADFIKLCLKETKIGCKNYKNLWTKLGISVDWSLSYSTINKLCQKISQRSFIELYHKGKLERREDPVIWCTTCQTALAQAELADKTETGFLNDVIFKINDKEFIVSTTRPELIPSCVALFVHPKDKRYKDIIGKRAIVPLFNYSVPILTDESVDISYGSGLMMVCTWGDAEDIRKWKEYKLNTRLILEKNGLLNDLAGKYKGLNVPETRKRIIQDLKENVLLKNQTKLNHVLNVHERCDTPVEFYKTFQWFIRILDMKDAWLDQANKLKWYPKYMKKIYDQWVYGLKWDWCISRERYYGVPFPVWYCSKCSTILLPKHNDLPVDPLKDKPEPCVCGSTDFVAEKAVMDTWMTSSLTPLINAKWGEKKNLMKIYPMGMRAQAFEIIRTWLFYTMLKSYFHTNSLPWYDVMISGHGLDPKGRKMSKSLGNMILPEEPLEKYPADALRFWAASANLGSNLPYQEKDVITGQKMITKLWNASLFAITHLQDYDLKKPRKLEAMDKWLLSKLNVLVKKVTNYFDIYEYSRAKTLTEVFFWHVFCDNYLEIIKDRLYNPKKRGKSARKSAQFTLYVSLLTILKLVAPIMPHVTEEIYHLYFAKKEKKKSIHITKWPVVNQKMIDSKIEKLGDKAVKYIERVRQFKSKKGKSLKEKIKMVLDDKNLKVMVDDLEAVTNATIKFGKKFEISF